MLLNSLQSSRLFFVVVTMQMQSYSVYDSIAIGWWWWLASSINNGTATHSLSTIISLWLSVRSPYFSTVSFKLLWLAESAENRLILEIKNNKLVFISSFQNFLSSAAITNYTNCSKLHTHHTSIVCAMGGGMLWKSLNQNINPITPITKAIFLLSEPQLPKSILRQMLM